MSVINFDNLPHWQDENHLQAFSAFFPLAKNYNKKIASQALTLQPNITKLQAKKFFEENFYLKKITTPGMLTAYFQPKVFGSLVKTSRFCYPLYKLPPDLIKNKIYKYDRADIENGALANKKLELVFVEDAVVAFFIHVQGCANIILQDENKNRAKNFFVNFAGKTGHKYTSLGKILSKDLKINPNKMTAAKLKKWLYQNKQLQKNFLAQNRSYIFFKQIKQGAIGAADITLQKYRSIAIDNNFHKFGTAIWLEADLDIMPHLTPRLTIAHDKGSAIKGIARADIFMGSGKMAEKLAGKIRHKCQFVLLLPYDK